MLTRSLVITVQLSLVLLGCERMSHAQDSPSDLVVGELTSTHAPWLPCVPSKSDDSDGRDALRPNYASDACDAMRHPAKKPLDQASRCVPRNRKMPRASHELRAVNKVRAAYKLRTSLSESPLPDKPGSIEPMDPIRRVREALQAAGRSLRSALLSVHERDSKHFAST